MPRNGSGVYSADWVNATPNTTIESAKVNAMVADLVVDANAARPVTAGGTGATSAPTARTALGVGTADLVQFARVGTNIAPTYQIDGYVSGSSNAAVVARNDTVSATVSAVGTTQANVGTLTNHPVVFIANNTEQFRLLGSGELVINGTAVIEASTAPLQITRSDGTGFIIQRTTAVGSLAAFYYGSTSVGSISTDGTNTAYNTSSDERLKENFADFDAGSIIDAISIYQYDWKSGGHGYGPKAQELFEVFPLAATPGNDKQPGELGFEPWSYDPSKLVPLLLREVQSLRARLAALEA